MKGSKETKYFWPVINGTEIEAEYELVCTDKWPDRDDESAGEVWEFVDQSAKTDSDNIDFDELDDLALKHAKKRGYIE